jgi:hypothetical protein
LFLTTEVAFCELAEYKPAAGGMGGGDMGGLGGGMGGMGGMGF